MKQIKGTILLVIVKSIKANHNKIGEYESILSQNAKEFLNKRILTGSWYPFEIYRELYDALGFVEVKNNPKILVEWGKVEGKRVYTTIYSSSIITGDIQLAIEKYSRFHRRVFNFGEVLTEIISDNEIEFTYIDMPRDWENWYHSAVGWAMSFIELTINKNTDYSFSNKSWKGEGWTKARISWVP
ncbi:MAG: hypothetical protein ACFFDH_04420 [Promethearchaeota archaeon]